MPPPLLSPPVSLSPLQWRVVAARRWQRLPQPCPLPSCCQHAAHSQCCRRHQCNAGKLLLLPSPCYCCASRHVAAAVDAMLPPRCHQSVKLPSWLLPPCCRSHHCRHTIAAAALLLPPCCQAACRRLAAMLPPSPLPPRDHSCWRTTTTVAMLPPPKQHCHCHPHYHSANAATTATLLPLLPPSCRCRRLYYRCCRCHRRCLHRFCQCSAVALTGWLVIPAVCRPVNW